MEKVEEAEIELRDESTKTLLEDIATSVAAALREACAREQEDLGWSFWRDVMAPLQFLVEVVILRGSPTDYTQEKGAYLAMIARPCLEGVAKSALAVAQRMIELHAFLGRPLAPTSAEVDLTELFRELIELIDKPFVWWMPRKYAEMIRDRAVGILYNGAVVRISQIEVARWNKEGARRRAALKVGDPLCDRCADLMVKAETYAVAGPIHPEKPCSCCKAETDRVYVDETILMNRERLQNFVRDLRNKRLEAADEGESS